VTGPSDPLGNLTLGALERFAAEVLPDYALDYYSTGARDELSLRGNLAAWSAWWFLPRVLEDVSSISLRTTVLGEEIALPLLVAPMAAQRMAHPDGEMATAGAAANAGTLMIVSTSTTTPIEDLTAIPNARVWFQLYPFTDREATVAMIDRAVAAGARAVVVTVDVPVEADTRRRPRGGPQIPPWVVFPLHPHAPSIEKSLDWAYLEWLRGRVNVPIVLKGILHPDDARRAAESGFPAIVVSNHGGRQLDGALPTAEVLPEIADAVGDQIELYVDGGIRRGADILRALALGARAVLVGRPFLWGLALGGEPGARRVFEILRAELEADAALAGVADLRAVPRGLVRPSRLLFPTVPVLPPPAG
jgi:4-hydroxymandelate oxidase